MTKILTVVGARPQFVKAAMVSRALKGEKAEEMILHTGQHYDSAMSKIFFEQMKIPRPYKNLNVGSGRHAQQTGVMMAKIEDELLATKPDWMLVYGDTNSTLAAGLAAVKVHVPVAHVEAGLRSFDRSMPEEVNRVVVDHISERLFCPTRTAMEQLHSEGITKGVEHVGDVMHDAALTFAQLAKKSSNIIESLNLNPGHFFLATLHRAKNTDDTRRLTMILEAFAELARRQPVVLPIHPRTRARVTECELEHLLEAITVVEPVSFFDMIELERNAAAILTDSGGVQKEAYFYRTPCITLRDETEWTETVDSGWNQIVGADKDKILQSVTQAGVGNDIADYGAGDSSKRIAQSLVGS